MGKPYSMDLRERVVAAVEEGRLSRRQAAERFGVGVSTAINWVRRFRETGSVAPGQMGGHKPKAIRDAHRDWLLELSFKKNRGRQRTGPSRRRAKTGAVGKVSGPDRA